MKWATEAEEHCVEVSVTVGRQERREGIADGEVKRERKGGE